MLSFNEWSDLMESSEVVVSGPGVDRLRAKIFEMGGRGAPTERNDFGFNHGDWTLYQRLDSEGHMDSEGIPVRIAGVMLRMLSHYANTQVPEFREINALVKADVDRATGAQSQGQSDSKAIVYDRQALEYGKIKVYVPGGLDRSLTMAVNRIVDEKFRSEGAPTVVDKWGKEGYPRFKRFSSDRSGINLYRVHRDIIADFVSALKSKGLEVEYESGASGPVSSVSTPSQATSTEPDVTVMGKERTEYGERLVVKFAYEKSKGLYDSLRASGLMPKAISWGGSGRYRVNIEDRGQFDMVVSAVKEFGLDPAALEIFAGTHFAASAGQPNEESGSDRRVLSFRDEGSDLMSVRVDYRGMDSATKEFIKECIQYTFPEYKWHGPPDYKYVVKGNYKQYVTFGRLLKKFKFNVDELRDILKAKTDSGAMSKTAWEGRMDRDDGFMSSIENKFPESDFDLYDEQKFGVAFLYGRDSAILGDSTGLGKCLLPESWVQTSKGILSLEQIWDSFAENKIINEDGEEWATPSSEIYVHSMDQNEKMVKSKIVGLYREKINSEIKEVTTSNGRTVRCTIPHKFYTDEGWRNDISEGDLVCSSPNMPCLDTNDFDDKELAAILGWQISEGWESTKRATVRISQKDESVLEKLQNLLKNKNIKSKIYKNKTSSILSINSKEYKYLLESMGYVWGRKSAEKSIPQFLMNSNNDVVSKFLRSFFDAECHVNPRCRQIELSTASVSISIQIQVLLNRFGIFSICKEKMKMATNGTRTLRKYYSIYICGSSLYVFFEKIGLDFEYKNKSFFDIKTKNNPNKEGKPLHRIIGPFFAKYDIPSGLMNVPSDLFVTGQRMATNKTISNVIDGFKRLRSGELLEEYMKLKKSKWTKSTISAIKSTSKIDIENAISKMEVMLNNDLYYEKVLKVSKVKYKGYVYDLCVEGTQNYVANGIICHNTIQLIKAAELRMRETNKPTLIVTLKSVQKQFAKEIMNVMGEGERSKISLDPLNPAKWTVLYYENFSSGKNLEKVIEKLSSTDFGVVIFDELHKIKHGKTKRSRNIYRVIERIPTRWGASATVSSNKPMDVKNQLEMIGHHLGKVDRKKFARDFAGAESYGGPTDKDEREIMAAERLNKWLNLSGVYVRREKGEVRKMPDMRVEQSATEVDPTGFREMMATTLGGYKNPDLPVSRLIAAREAIARLKTGETTKKVLDIVSAGKGKPPAASKVVVFTNFVGAAKELVERIRAGLKEIDPSYKLITYLSNTKKKERDDVKKVFTDDPNAKVLVMSMRMGGTGIDFPNAAQNMVINDFDWTPEAAEQSEGRIYRINTDHPVDITYVVGQGLDRDLFERVRRKREIAAIIQRYRREYHETDDKEALKKIVAAQKEIKEIDKQMAAKVAAEVPGAEGALKESFRNFLDMASAFLLG
jgi:intein/homing endonuclease/superfamily II DNA or RNA helicase